MSEDIKQPLNQILYGPPGTGKTYNTIDKALQIIVEKESDDTSIKHTFQEYDIDATVSNIKSILSTNPIDRDSESRQTLKSAFDSIP
jgi:5-methylcytosine-specific restriction endonuclease McrBC GTP-binding regulatory subunit McrB